MKVLDENEKQTVPAENRMWPRIKCDIDTHCVAFPHQWPCKIIDLSERGMGIVSTMKLYKGALINIIDPRTKARVVWLRDNRIGLKIEN